MQDNSSLSTNNINSKYTNVFLNDYFLNDKKNSSGTDKITRISDNIINLNPVPLYLNPVIMHYQKVNIGVKEAIRNLDKNIDIKYYNDEDGKKMGFFTTQGARVTSVDILSYNEDFAVTLKSYINEGIKEMLYHVYNYYGRFNTDIIMSNIHSYSDGTFVGAHTHKNYTNIETNFSIRFSAAYYVDDGDPNMEYSNSGCVSFITNDRPYHIRPKAGTLLIWESNLVHYVNPFYSKSNKERIVITTNFTVNLLDV